MKQIVFLISAFLMLFQIHSTVTAIPIDTSTGESVPNDVEGDKEVIRDAGVIYYKLLRWNDIKENLLQLTDIIENLMTIFRGQVENAWESENVEPTTNWEIRTNEIKDRVEEIKVEIVEFTDGLADQEPIAWTDVEEAMNELLEKMIEVMEECADLVIAKASGTEEERSEIVNEVFQIIMNVMNESWAKGQEIIINEITKASN